MSLFDDDDDGIFETTTTKSKYSSLFDDDEPPKSSTTSILTNLSVKPSTEVSPSKPTQTVVSSPKPTQTVVSQTQPKYPTILHSGKVEVYKENESSAEYTTVGIAIAENKTKSTQFQLILYYTKENYLANVPISSNFVLTTQMKDDRYFGNFYDHQNKPWVFRFVSEDDVDNLLLYIAFAKHIESDRKRPTYLDIYSPSKGTIINDTFRLGIKYVTYAEEKGKLNPKESKNVVTTIGGQANKKEWDDCLEGMKKFGRKAIITTEGDTIIAQKLTIVKLAPLKKETAPQQSKNNEVISNVKEKSNTSKEKEEYVEYKEIRNEQKHIEKVEEKLPQVDSREEINYETTIEHQIVQPQSQPQQQQQQSQRHEDHYQPQPQQQQQQQQSQRHEDHYQPQHPQSQQHQSPPQQQLYQSPQQQQQQQQYQSQPPQQVQSQTPQPQNVHHESSHFNQQPQHQHNYNNSNPNTFNSQPQQSNFNSYNYVSPIHTNNSNSSLSLTTYSEPDNYFQNQSQPNQFHGHMDNSYHNINSNNQYQNQYNNPNQYQNQNNWNNQPQNYQQPNSPYPQQKSEPDPQKELVITPETIQHIVEEKQLKSEIKMSLTKIYEKLDEVSRKLDNTIFAKDIKTVGMSAKTLLQCVQRIVYENESMLSEIETRNQERFGLNFD